MWFLYATNNDGSSKPINSLFSQKHEAIKCLKNEYYSNGFFNVELRNIDTDLVSDELRVGIDLFINKENKKVCYGKIHDITNYLIEVKVPSGEITTFRKNRINREILNGVFCI